MTDRPVPRRPCDLPFRQHRSDLLSLVSRAIAAAQSLCPTNMDNSQRLQAPNRQPILKSMAKLPAYGQSDLARKQRDTTARKNTKLGRPRGPAQEPPEAETVVARLADEPGEMRFVPSGIICPVIEDTGDFQAVRIDEARFFLAAWAAARVGLPDGDDVGFLGGLGEAMAPHGSAPAMVGEAEADRHDAGPMRNALAGVADQLVGGGDRGQEAEQCGPAHHQLPSNAV
jgi:hypothetical protein